LAKSPTTLPKVDKYLPPPRERERERALEALRKPHAHNQSRREPPMGHMHARASPRWVVKRRPHDGGFPLRSRPGVNNGHFLMTIHV